MSKMPVKIRPKLRRLKHEITQIIVLFSVLCSLFSVGYAAPCYGTKMPAKKELFMGLQSRYIFNRYLEHEAGKIRSRQEFLLLSYGVSDWLAIDLKGGSGNIKQHPGNADELDYPTYLGGGYGFRLKLYTSENLKAVFSFQHISIHPETVSVAGQKHKAVLDDWQFSTLLSYDFKKITPYLGVKWSRLDYIHWIDTQRDRVRSDLTKSIGLIFGLDMPVSKNIWLNLEGELLDSEALSLSLNYKF